MTLVKICGLSTIDALDAAIAAGARAISDLCSSPSRRATSYLTPPTALASRACPRASSASACWSMPTMRCSIPSRRSSTCCNCRAPRPLHASPTSVAAHGARWRAGPPASPPAPTFCAAIGDARGVADRLLFDAKAPRGASLSGGNGVRFDWQLLDGIDPGMAWGLAGGLDPGNVGAALAMQTRAPLVDGIVGGRRRAGDQIGG